MRKLYHKHLILSTSTTALFLSTAPVSVRRRNLQADDPDKKKKHENQTHRRERLFKQKDADHHSPKRTDSRPNGISRAQRQRFGGLRKQVQAYQHSCNHCHRVAGLLKPIGKFHKRSPNDLEQSREHQINPCHNKFPPKIKSTQRLHLPWPNDAIDKC